MKKLSILLGISALAFAFALTATPVLAHTSVDVTAANEETGAESDNDNITKIDESGNVIVNNNGDVDNIAKAKANTGHNTQDKNTKGGDMTTGSIDATTDWKSTVNEGWGLCGCPFGDSDSHIVADFLNKLTGFKSDNLNLLKVEDTGDVVVNNNATILNKLKLYANTGHNSMDKNTEGGDMTTGDVLVSAAITNMANVSGGSAAAASGSGWTVDVTASNEKTGAFSDNDNIVKVKHSGNVILNNNADVDNIVKVKANTGHNTMDKNTTAGTMTTGDVEVTADITNTVNSGSCCPSGEHHEVTADLSNETTGYKSDNTNKVTVEDTGDVVVNNNAQVDNVVKVEANTGHNSQDQNTEGGGVETGSVTVDFSSSTSVNSVE